MNQALSSRVYNLVIRTGLLRTSFVLALATLPLFGILVTLLLVALLGSSGNWENITYLWSFPADNAWIFLLLLMFSLGFSNVEWEKSWQRQVDTLASFTAAYIVADSIVLFYHFCERHANMIAPLSSAADSNVLMGVAAGSMMVGIACRLIKPWNLRVMSFLDDSIRKMAQ